MAEQVTTPDFSPAPRQKWVEFNPAVPQTFLNPSALYLQLDATDGSCTISFTPWGGTGGAADLAGGEIPLYSQGKFDMVLVRSVEATSGVSRAWRAF